MNLNMSVPLPAGIFALALPRMVGKFSRNEYAARARRRRGWPVPRPKGKGSTPAASDESGLIAAKSPAVDENLMKLRRLAFFMEVGGGKCGVRGNEINRPAPNVLERANMAAPRSERKTVKQRFRKKD